MQIDTVEKSKHANDDVINFEFTCSAGKSIEVLTVESEHTDYIIIGIGTGKILQFSVDLEILSQIQNGLTDPQINELLDEAMVDENGDENNQQALWGAIVTYVGTLLPKLSKIHTQNGTAVVASCDRPVIFYVNQKD